MLFNMFMSQFQHRTASQVCWFLTEPEMEPGLRVTGHGSAILAGSGRVMGQCVRPGV